MSLLCENAKIAIKQKIITRKVKIMALNATELRILNHQVSLVRGNQSFSVPVLSLGYPFRRRQISSVVLDLIPTEGFKEMPLPA